MRSLNQLLWLQRLLVKLRWAYFVKFWGMDIDPSTVMSLSVRLDKTYPKGVHIGPDSYLAFDVAVLAHDMTRGLYCDTYIGARCFIGARSIILPGVRIGDGSIVGSGSVVTRDVPPASIVAGNPARVIRRNIEPPVSGACAAPACASRRRPCLTPISNWQPGRREDCREFKSEFFTRDMASASSRSPKGPAPAASPAMGGEYGV